MTISFKKALLTGTALVAVSFAATVAKAADLQTDASQVWAAQDSSGLALELAQTNDNLDIYGYTVTVTNDGVANDGGGYNTFAIGNVTDTYGGGSLLVTTGGNNDLDVTFGSNINISGALNVQGDDADDADITVSVNGFLATDTLNVSTTESDSSNAVSLNITGSLDVYGATTITGGEYAGADATLILNDDANFEGGLTLTDGAGGGKALVVFNGGSDIYGAIDGGSDGQGTIVVNGNSVFHDAIGGSKSISMIQVGSDNANAYVTFYGDVAADTINMGGAGTDYDYNSVTFNSYNGAITIDAAVQGAEGSDYNNVIVTSAYDGDYAADNTVTQTVAWTKNLNHLTVDHVNFISKADLTFAGGITVNGDDSIFEIAAGTTTADIFMNDEDSTLVLNGGNIVGNVSSYDDGYGILNVLQSGKITGTLGALQELTVSGKNVTLTVTGNTNAADLTDIGANKINVTGGDFTLGSGQELDVAISSATTSGQVIVSGKAFVNTGASVVVTANGAYSIADGTKFVIIDGLDSGTGVGNIGTNLDVSTLDTALLHFTQDTTNTHDFVLVANTVSLNDAIGGGLSQPAAAAGDALQAAAVSDPNATITTILANLDAAAMANKSAVVESILSSVAPTVDGAATNAGNSFGQQVQHIAATRMFNLTHGDNVASNGQQGIAAGSATSGTSLWVQGFGQSAKQDTRDLIAGYDADSAGAAMGVDTANLIKNGILGVSFNYAKTNANSKNSNTTGTDIDSYGVNFYASKGLKDGYFVNGQVGYAYNDIDTARHNVGGLGGTANANYGSDLYSAQIAGGKDYNAGGSMTLTPSLSASYLHLATDGYTETGTGAPLLTVGSENADSLKVGAGLTAMWNLKDEDGARLRPTLSVGYAYDTLSDNVESTSHFTTGGPAFTAMGADPERSEFNAGAGLTYLSTANWDLSATYDYTYKQDYAAHTGVARATVHF